MNNFVGLMSGRGSAVAGGWVWDDDGRGASCPGVCGQTQAGVLGRECAC